MALNETGTAGDIGLHARLAILSARQYTDLEPFLMYTGERNSFTQWAEDLGVRVLQSRLPYLNLSAELSEQKRYNMNTVGHWLRTILCLEETDDEHVLYTDVDILFMRSPQLASIKPDYFAAAPEFDPNSLNYINAGVMVMNVPAMRSEYRLFEEYLRLNIARKTFGFHDQIAYNEFYRGRWNKLPLALNWKPYWGISDDTEILHFHGPKFAAIEAILEGKWNWESGHGQQIGSLFAAHTQEYRWAFRQLGPYLDKLPGHEARRLASIAEKIESHDTQDLQSRVDLSFTKFRMFPSDAWVQ
jgi:hypothetical protein